MAALTLTRTRLWFAGIVGLVAIGAASWFFQPDRQLRRSWQELLASVEARNPTRLGRILAGDYRDRWGYTRRTLLDDARLAFFQIRHLKFTSDQTTITREGDRATVRAILRIDAGGSAEVDNARTKINALFTPFEFTWQREPGFTGAWRLVGFDHPDLDLRQFRPRW